MAEPEPMMTKTMKLSGTRQNFSPVLTQVFRGQTRILVEKSGIPIADIVSTQDWECFTQLEAKRAKDFFSAKADYLASGDAKLQKLGADEGGRIVSLRAFWEILQSLPKGEARPDR